MTRGSHPASECVHSVIRVVMTLPERCTARGEAGLTTPARRSTATYGQAHRQWTTTLELSGEGGGGGDVTERFCVLFSEKWWNDAFSATSFDAGGRH